MSLKRLSDDRSLHVAPHEPQLQHFQFYNDRGDRLGKVEDLIADDTTMKVRFLMVSMHDGLLHNRTVIIPIRDVAIDADAQRVICADCREETLKGYPEYKGGKLADLTKRFAATFMPGTGATTERPTATGVTPQTPTGMADKSVVGDWAPLLGRKAEVNDPMPMAETRPAIHTELRTADEAPLHVIDEALPVDKREVPTGEADVRKAMGEAAVCEPVELRQDHVEIERHAVNRPSDVAPGQGPMAFRPPTMGEAVITRKVPVVKEEIILHRTTDVTHQQDRGEVRKENVQTKEVPQETLNLAYSSRSDKTACLTVSRSGLAG